MAIDKRWQSLNTAIISDVLDSLGAREQVMYPGLSPINKNDQAIGRARTGLWVKGGNPEGNAYLNLVNYIDSLGEDDFVVFAQEEIPVCSLWGDILSTVCSAKGGAGAIIDGLIRDPNGIEQVGFPVFSKGNTPIDPDGRAYLSVTDKPIHCSKVLVETGMLIFADVDGVIVVPPKLENEVLVRGGLKLQSETTAMQRLLLGEKLSDVFADLGAV